MRPWVVLALLTGCNQVYGLDATELAPDESKDLDSDNIPDVEDPCLASEADRVADFDQDGVLDDVDGCLLVDNTIDSDADGISDICDPHPMLAGDRVRCSTTFQSQELSSAIWRPREGEAEMLLAAGALVGLGAGSGVREGVLGSAPTIVADIAWNTAFVHQQFSHGVWVSALGVPSMAGDVACILASDSTSVRLLFAGTPNATSPAGAVPAIQKPTADTATIGFRVYLQPAGLGTNVVCYASYEAATGRERLIVRGHVDAPLGGFGFFVRRGVASVIGFSILETNETPPLP